MTDGIVTAPRTEYFAVEFKFRTLFRFQAVNHVLDVLHFVFVRNHDGVFGFYHHHVIQANNGNQTLFGVDVAVVYGF